MTTISPWRPSPLDRFLIGVAHYPEQDDRALIGRDADLMAEAGIEVVRMGEFAWSLIEPAEGSFAFDLFEEAIETLGALGIDTIFCTPTAAPPRWLTARHPDMLRRDATGRTMRHGSRQHADLSHPLFRAHGRRITSVLAERFRGNPHVIGWQTDNELNTHFSETHSEAAQGAFRDWLERRYGDIESLNHAWGCAFWNRRYDGFDQIETPIQNAPAAADPSHMLDYHRFLADLTADFHREQADILRGVRSDWFVFHNVGRVTDIDVRQLARDADILGVDVYPFLADEMLKAGVGYAQAAILDTFRGWTGSFIVPEQQTGFGAQPGFASPAAEPGELRRMTMSSIAHGADGIVYFRWRTARFGAEAYWMGVLDHDGVPRRKFDELRATIAELKTFREDLRGTTVDIDVAILAADWDNQEAQASYPMGLPSVLEASIPLHAHCYHRHIACGFAAPGDELSQVRLVFVPHLPIWDDAWTANLRRFAEAGGIVVVGARSATRDVNNHVLSVTPPGPLAALCGVAVTEFGRLPAIGASSMNTGHVFQTAAIGGGTVAESARRRHAIGLGDTAIDAAHWYEVLEPAPGTEVLACWTSRSLAGLPAITRRRVGTGSVIYLGTYLTLPIVAALFEPLFAECEIVPVLAAGSNIDVTTRSGEGRSLTFVQNTGRDPVSIDTPEGPIDLGAFDCRVLRR